MLLDILVVLAALTGCVGGVAALALYIADRRAIRAAVAQAETLVPSIRQATADVRVLASQARDPAWVGACLAHAVTHGVQTDDGQQATVPDVMHGLITAHLPGLVERAGEILPQLIATAFSTDLAKEMATKSAVARGASQLGGGLRGAQALQHGLRTMGGGPLGSIGQLLEMVPALIETVSKLRGLKDGGGAL